MTAHSETSIKYLITLYQQGIFALVMYLIGGEKNTAYNVTVAAFVKAFQSSPSLDNEDAFLIKLAAAAVEMSRDVKVPPADDNADFINLPPEKRRSLNIAKTALGALPFEARVYLLLRDQMHLPYAAIASITGKPDKASRIQTTEARGQLREKLEEVLRRG